MCDVIGHILLWLFLSVGFSNWMEILKVVGAGTAFGIGLYQYRKSETWKRVQFLADEMKSFYDDPAVKLAMGMLDWRKKRVPLFRYRGGKDVDDLVDVDYALVASSLGTSPELKYEKDQCAIREIFERLLEFLARFEGFIATGVVNRDDFVPYLDYWVKLIAGQDRHSREVTEQVLPNLWQFIDFFGYRDVRRFIGRYETVKFPELSR